MTGVLIVAARRSPVAPRGGALARLGIHELGSPVLARALADTGLRPENVDEVIVSNALGAGGNPARVVALAAGLPERVAGLSIDRQCAGGLDALVLGAALIRSGQAEIVAAGGIESYSRRPIRLRTDAEGGDPEPYDRPPFTPWPDRDPGMNEAAAQLAEEMEIGREEQDAWAVESHRKALAARDRMRDEIVPLGGLDGDAFARVLTSAVCRRAPRLAGSVTSANTAVAADAAAFCILVSDRVAQRLSLPGIAYLEGRTVGAAPEQPGIAPVPAIRGIMADCEMSPSNLSVAEVMEAYAVQAMACVSLAGLDSRIVNPGGGALARGHPIGASGAINAVRLFHELRQRGGTGLAAIAAAGGVGTAVLMRRD